MRGAGAASLEELDAFERSFWLDVWRAPVLDAVAEEQIEARWYGPVQAMTVPGLSRTPLLNRVLGGAEPRVADDGFLGEALEWIESQRVDLRVPLTPGRPGAPATEELLMARGYLPREGLARFVRTPNTPDFFPPPGIEVIELGEYTEGFSDHLCAGLGLEPMAAGFIDTLPGRMLWRCYVALDEAECPIASAAMMVHRGIAQLCFAATGAAARCKGAHLALLHRRILDATASGECHTLLAEAAAPLDPDAGPHAAARNLVRAGFEPLVTRALWGPDPADLEEDEDEDLEDEEGEDEELGWWVIEEDDEDGEDDYGGAYT